MQYDQVITMYFVRVISKNTFAACNSEMKSRETT